MKTLSFPASLAAARIGHQPTIRAGNSIREEPSLRAAGAHPRIFVRSIPALHHPGSTATPGCALPFCGGNQRPRFFFVRCSATELQQLSSLVGIEPATLGSRCNPSLHHAANSPIFFFPSLLLYSSSAHTPSFRAATQHRSLNQRATNSREESAFTVFRDLNPSLAAFPQK